MQFNTKAQNLRKLYSDCPEVNVLPEIVVYSTEFDTPAFEIKIDSIIKKFGPDDVIVRSSCSNEDSDSESNAGKYDSKLNVPARKEELVAAIKEVYSSYNTSKDEEILVQPMLKNVLWGGVAFTRDLQTNAPYYCIDYTYGNDTAAVTSGTRNSDKTKIIYRAADLSGEDGDIVSLLDAVKSIEKFFACDALDIEFGITFEHKVYIFQVRPITNAYKKEAINSEEFDFSLRGISKKIEKLMRPRPFLVGDTSYFGVMSDWNPAEMLGIRPKKLAISLYKELITDNIWAHQRNDYGYRNLTQSPLMVLFCGIPYIDTRIAFNSFVPAALSEKLANKLVNYYLLKLKKHPSYHDKIEFEIVFSCYYPGIANELRKLEKFGFNENELKRIEYSLLELTNNVINPVNGLYKEDIRKIEILKNDHEKIINSDISTVEKIYWLIEKCKTNGTLPFAGIARAAFIAVQFLKALVKEGDISQEDYDSFMLGLNTISSQMGKDRSLVNSGKISKEEFLEKYGHVRPGTYDIESPRYDEAYGEYFGNDANGQVEDGLSHEESKNKEFSLTKEKMRKINEKLEENGICVDAAGLFTFAKEAIEGREYLKFVFTRTVSEILKQIEIYGKRLGITKNDLAHLDIHEIKQLYADLFYGDISQVFKQNIKMNEQQHKMSCKVKLPILIMSPKDVFSFEMQDEEPNFITMKKIVAEVVCENGIYEKGLSGKIVCVKAADPGYDFLFTKGIAGLITQFGGANSHMAIRCAELGIPAVIGAGEKNYNLWSRQHSLLIDAKNRQVKSYNLFFMEEP